MVLVVVGHKRHSGCCIKSTTNQRAKGTCLEKLGATKSLSIEIWSQVCGEAWWLWFVVRASAWPSDHIDPLQPYRPLISRQRLDQISFRHVPQRSYFQALLAFTLIQTSVDPRSQSPQDENRLLHGFLRPFSSMFQHAKLLISTASSPIAAL